MTIIQPGIYCIQHCRSETPSASLQQRVAIVSSRQHRLYTTEEPVRWLNVPSVPTPLSMLSKSRRSSTAIRIGTTYPVSTGAARFAGWSERGASEERVRCE